MPDEQIGVPSPDPQPGNPQEEVKKMDAVILGSMQAVVLSQAQGHAFTMESGRLNHLAGVMSTREGLTHRIISEAGGGQSRAQLPGGRGGVPTAGA